MLRKAQNALSFLTIAAAASIATGQTLNIDYADPWESTPWGAYSGAGSPGFWNRIYGEHGVPETLFYAHCGYRHVAGRRRRSVPVVRRPGHHVQR